PRHIVASVAVLDRRGMADDRRAMGFCAANTAAMVRAAGSAQPFADKPGIRPPDRRAAPCAPVEFLSGRDCHWPKARRTQVKNSRGRGAIRAKPGKMADSDLALCRQR